MEARRPSRFSDTLFLPPGGMAPVMPPDFFARGESDDGRGRPTTKRSARSGRANRSSTVEWSGGTLDKRRPEQPAAVRRRAAIGADTKA